MMRVLALVPGGIGDQLLFFPTLETLKRKFPEAALDVVVEPRSMEAYRVTNLVQRVWSFDFKDRNSLSDWGNLLGNIREQEYSAVLSLGKSWTVGFFLWLTGIPQRVSFAKDGQIWLTNPVVLQENQYAAAMYHDLLQGFGIQTNCPAIRLNVAKEDLEWATVEQKRLGITESGYVLLHGGSSALAIRKGIYKIYPAEKWVVVIEALQKAFPALPIVILQGPEDSKLLLQLQDKTSLKVTIPPDLGKTAAMIAAANLLLCTDSAPMHIGVAVKTALVALFGPTDPQRLLPRDDRFKAIKSSTGNIDDIDPQVIIATVLGK